MTIAKAKPRLKVVRAMEPNRGLIQEFKRKIARVVATARQEVIAAGLPLYQEALAKQSSALSLQANIKTDAMPSMFPPLLAAINEAEARAMIKAGEEAYKVSYWYARKMLRHVSLAQRRNLRKAGVSMAILRQRWTAPLIKGQFIAPNTANGIASEIEWATKLITKMSKESIAKVQTEMARGLEHGHSLSRLKGVLSQLENMDEARAARVARDQSCKLNQFIQRENNKSLGITEGIWVHVPGLYESRATHMAMHGKKYDLNTGMYDPEVNQFVQPAELPFCRCVFRAVIPTAILEKK